MARTLKRGPARDVSSIGGRIVALIIRPLTAQDLSEAGRIIRLAFGTFLGAPEPEQFWTDIDYAPTHAGTPILQQPSAWNSTASWSARTSPRAGGVWDYLGRCPCVLTSGIKILASASWNPSWHASAPGGYSMSGYSPLRTVPNMSVCIRNTAAGRAFSRPSCRSR
jgi:hypothetical protein